MAKLKVYVDDAPLTSGHAVRGMGFYTRNLIHSLEDSGKVNLVSEDEAELIHYPYFDLFVNSLKLSHNKKFIVTVPDVIPLLYPKIYKPGIRGKIALFQQIKALKKADAILTISETSKKDIVRLLGVPAEKIHVAYLGPGNKLVEATLREKSKDKYVLYVGDINWNKNTNNFVKALNKAKLKGVIIGKQAKELMDHPESFDFSHPQLQHLEELYDILKTSKNIKVMGFLDEDQLALTMKMATVYCQPSFYEGFGLPLLEAMQAGLPIAAARTQALVEVADDAATYFDPNSVDDIATTLTKLTNDEKLRKSLISKGNTRLREFSWENTANDTIEVYQQILSNK